MSTQHLSRGALDSGLPEILDSPRETGVLALIVKRPSVDERKTVEVGTLSVSDGLEGDNWKLRRNPHPEMQLNIMNARVAALVAQDPSRWQLAGDQLYVDLDLSLQNLPPGSQLRVGAALVEVTAIPHRGCRKFVARFGRAAMEFVNSEVGRQLNLRGINAKVIDGGGIKVNDTVTVERRGAA
jgi:MOSC domain-containing protein YiiM